MLWELSQLLVGFGEVGEPGLDDELNGEVGHRFAGVLVDGGVQESDVAVLTASYEVFGS